MTDTFEDPAEIQECFLNSQLVIVQEDTGNVKMVVWAKIYARSVTLVFDMVIGGITHLLSVTGSHSNVVLVMHVLIKMFFISSVLLPLQD